MHTSVESVEDLVRVARALQRMLEQKGEFRAALQLCNSLSDFYTTSTEAIGSIVDAIQAARTASQGALNSSEQGHVQQILRDAKKLMDLK
jgi:hypothetical protein